MEGWFVLITFTNPQDAHMAKAYLESYEVKVVLQDELTVQVYNFWSNAIGGVKLWVRNEDYRRAAGLMEEGGYIVPDAMEEGWIWIKAGKDKRHCPFCHSDNIGQARQLGIAALIIFFLFSCLFPIFRKTWKCFDCGRSWKYKK